MYKRNKHECLKNSYSHRVRIGNWFETQILDEFKHKKKFGHPDKGNSILSQFRTIENNLNKPTELTACAGSVSFGARITLVAPHVPNCYPPVEGEKGLSLGGRIPLDRIHRIKYLEDGCSVVGITNLTPTVRNTFVITSADYCDREGEVLKYNQEFHLALCTSINEMPLYLRYDPEPVPGCYGKFPLYLSKHSLSNDRWRVLPIQGPDLTRFEQEGRPIPVNSDVIINHCATNKNLGMNSEVWSLGVYNKNYAPLMKTCLGVTGKELPINIWQIKCLIKS